MKATIDSSGRIVIPKALRNALGLAPGTTVDLSLDGAGLHLIPVGRTARLRGIGENLVAESDTVITDDGVLALLGAGRK